DEVGHEPVVHLGRSRLAQHRVVLGRREVLRAGEEDRDEARRGVPARPQLARELEVVAEGPGERAQPREDHGVLVAGPLVARADVRGLEGREISAYLGRRRQLLIVGAPGEEAWRPGAAVDAPALDLAAALDEDSARARGADVVTGAGYRARQPRRGTTM